MNPAIRAKSAQSRATIAIRCLHTIKYLGGSRTFECCFEMNDGDEVVAHIILRAATDPALTTLVHQRGYGYWLAADYLARMTRPGKRSSVVQQAIIAQAQCHGELPIPHGHACPDCVKAGHPLPSVACFGHCSTEYERSCLRCTRRV